MKAKKANRSKLATILVKMIDETKILRRDEWASILCVTPSAISQWLNDKALPRAEVIRSILSLLKEHDRIKPELLEEFNSLILIAAREVSPLFRSRIRTLFEYLLAPQLERFLRDLDSLHPESQERVLLRASQMCAAEAGVLNSGSTYSLRTQLGRPSLEPRPITTADPVTGYILACLGWKNDQGQILKIANFCKAVRCRARTLNNPTPGRIVDTLLENGELESEILMAGTGKIKMLIIAVLFGDPDTVILVQDGLGQFRQVSGDVRITKSQDLARPVLALSRFNEIQLHVSRSVASYESISLEQLNALGSLEITHHV